MYSFFFFFSIKVLIPKVGQVFYPCYVDKSALTTLHLNLSQNFFAIAYLVRAFHLVLHCVLMFSLNNP